MVGSNNYNNYGQLIDWTMTHDIYIIAFFFVSLCESCFSIHAERFQLDTNQLRGSIPSEFGQLSDLRKSIQPFFGCDNYECFVLFCAIRLNLLLFGFNCFLFVSCSLETSVRLYLYKNQMTGTLPTELGRLENAGERQRRLPTHALD